MRSLNCFEALQDDIEQFDWFMACLWYHAEKKKTAGRGTTRDWQGSVCFKNMKRKIRKTKNAKTRNRETQTTKKYGLFIPYLT